MNLNSNSTAKYSVLFQFRFISIPLTNYNCGDPVCGLSFSALYRTSVRTRVHAGRVATFAPLISPAAVASNLVLYLVEKAFARIDPDPGQ